jgi:DNA-binding response OmpR family regulator
LVEDDLSLRRFVAMALEELDIDLLGFASVEDVLSSLEQQPADLIITDLMMPVLSGFDLIRILATAPELRANATLVVYSAGLNLEVRQLLQEQGVERFLSKPCSVAELEACVLAALAGKSPEQAAESNSRVVPPAPASIATATATESSTLESHFGGNLALYQSFRSSCLQQFEADVSAGDLACRQADNQALQRLAHSLKSVLLMLDQVPASGVAEQLEHSADQGDWAAASPLWASLRGSLQSLR